MDKPRSPRAPKSKFTAAEDGRLRDIISRGQCQDWADVAKQMPGRNPRQCRERWNNYVNPSIISTPWTEAEDELLVKKVAELGPRWQKMTALFPNRSKNQIKNHWLARERRMERRYSQPVQNNQEFDGLFEIPELEQLFPNDFY
jgi:hypothetical protein